MRKTPERKALENLTESVLIALRQIDKAMKGPATPERGRKVALICNNLELMNDQAMRFTLGLSFTQVANRKKKIENKVESSEPTDIPLRSIR